MTIQDPMICPKCHEVHDYHYDCDPDERRFQMTNEIGLALDEYEATRPARLDYAVQPFIDVRRLTAGENCKFFGPIVITGDRKKLRIGDNVRIDAFVKIEIGDGVTIGDNTHIASFAHINIGGGTLTLGRNNGIASGVRIVTGGNKVDEVAMTVTAPLHEQGLTYKDSVVIEDNVSILVNSVVLPGSHICAGSRLAAGGVLTGKAIPPNEIWGGVPAKFIRKRGA